MDAPRLPSQLITSNRVSITSFASALVLACVGSSCRADPPEEKRNAVQMGQISWTIRPISQSPVDVACSPDGKTVATISSVNDGTVELWRNPGLERMTVSLQDNSAGHCLAFSPDGKRLVAGCIDGIVRIWDLETGKVVRLPSIRRPVRGLAFSPDGLILAMPNVEDRTQLLNTGDWSVASVIRESWNSNGPMSISHDGALLATIHAGKAQIRLWDIRRRSLAFTLRGHNRGYAVLSFARDRLLSLDYESRLTVWELKEKNSLLDIRSNLHCESAISPDGKLVAVGYEDGTTKIANVESGRLVAALGLFSAGTDAMMFSPNGEYLFCITSEQTSRLAVIDLRRLQGSIATDRL